MKEDSERSLLMLFGQVAHLQLLRAYNLLDTFGVHPKQVPTLMVLKSHEGTSQKELVELLRVKAPTVAVTVKRLERAGYVERRGDEEDQRVSHINLTEYGKRIVEQIPSQMKQVEEEALRGFTQEEIMLMRRLLLQMRENLTMPPEEETVETPRGRTRHGPLRRDRFERED